IPRVDDVRLTGREMMDHGMAPTRARGEPKRAQLPAPEAIPVDVVGTALDTAGQPVRGATVSLITAWRSPRIVAETATDQNGHYAFSGAVVPVPDGSINGVKPQDTSPYAAFQVIATARGYGLSWHQPGSTHALADPDPNDLQRRHELGDPVTMDLT